MRSANEDLRDQDGKEVSVFAPPQRKGKMDETNYAYLGAKSQDREKGVKSEERDWDSRERRSRITNDHLQKTHKG